MDGVRRQNQPDNHTGAGWGSIIHQMLWRAASRKTFRDVSRLALLICPTLVAGIVSKMDYQGSEMKMTEEIPEESDIMLPMKRMPKEISKRSGAMSPMALFRSDEPFRKDDPQHQ